ncbi:MAG: hypothetical protein GX107_00790 [Clostridiales bacterium]|jgi:ribosomal protein L7Ae-like RNA K-turn-binding protein|nr:hypothetical protein [Clostridiales bacterium]
MDDKLLQLLGLCKKAGRLSWGHETCVKAVKDGNAKLALLARDASKRIKKDIIRAAAERNNAVEILETDYTMDQINAATGCFTGILTTYDEGFAKKIAEIHRIQSGRNTV